MRLSIANSGLSRVALGMMCALAALATSLVVDAAAQQTRREGTWRVTERPELIRRGPLDVPQVHLHRLIKE